MTNTFQQSLAHILDASAPVKMAKLYSLSMMHTKDFARFESVWPTIAAPRRTEILTALTHLTEESFEVNFDAIFIMGLNDPDPEVQVAAIKGLWENDLPALVPPFIHLLKTEETEAVRAAAATALGKYIYLGELEEMDSAALMLAEQALLETIRKPGETVEVIRRAIESISFSSQEGIDNLIEMAYYHEDEQMQVSALFAMGRNFNPKWEEIVLAELDNHRAEMRFEAARACGELAIKQSVDRLIQLIEEDPDLEVVQNAIWALGQIGGNQAKDVLDALVESADEAISASAEEALAELTLLGGELADLFDYNVDELPEDGDNDPDDGDSDYRTFNLN